MASLEYFGCCFIRIQTLRSHHLLGGELVAGPGLMGMIPPNLVTCRLNATVLITTSQLGVYFQAY